MCDWIQLIDRQRLLPTWGWVNWVLIGNLSHCCFSQGCKPQFLSISSRYLEPMGAWLGAPFISLKPWPLWGILWEGDVYGRPPQKQHTLNSPWEGPLRAARRAEGTLVFFHEQVLPASSRKKLCVVGKKQSVRNWESRIYHCLAVWSWESHLINLGFPLSVREGVGFR